MDDHFEILGGRFFRDGVELKLRSLKGGDTRVVSLHIDDLRDLVKAQIEQAEADDAELAFDFGRAALDQSLGTTRST